MVELTLGRNDPTGAWEYPPPFDLSPETLDWDTWLNDAPKIPFNKLHFARWRCWRVYGTGVAGDLMVHLISGMLFTLGWNEAPRSATALGGIVRWRDGRDMPDLHTVLFDYHGIPVYVRLGLGTETPELARFLGPKGILDAGEFEFRYSPQAGVDTDPSYYSTSFPAKMREEYIKQWHAEHDSSARKRTRAGRHRLSGPRLGRHASASSHVLPGCQIAQACDGGRSLRQQRSHRMSHGQ
jgi:predicted dehydrogenase